jgi:uncharacterized membrane protein YpjA
MVSWVSVKHMICVSWVSPNHAINYYHATLPALSSVFLPIADLGEESAAIQISIL